MTIDVVAAVIEGDDGRLLVTRRAPGTHLEGLWEFPGGKVLPGEAPAAALGREIDEELGARVEVGALVLDTTHAYDDRRVRLRFFRCRLLDPPRARLGQGMRWVTRDELQELDFPPADAELIRRLSTREPAP